MWGTALLKALCGCGDCPSSHQAHWETARVREGTCPPEERDTSFCPYCDWWGHKFRDILVWWRRLGWQKHHSCLPWVTQHPPLPWPPRPPRPTPRPPPLAHRTRCPGSCPGIYLASLSFPQSPGPGSPTPGLWRAGKGPCPLSPWLGAAPRQTALPRSQPGHFPPATLRCGAARGMGARVHSPACPRELG